jgi:hypothetical protein
LKSPSPIEQRILDYLTANPAAQDTLRGIIEWWLLEQRIAETKSDIETALANLVADRKLTAKVAADGELSYRLNRKRAGSKVHNSN